MTFVKNRSLTFIIISVALLFGFVQTSFAAAPIITSVNPEDEATNVLPSTEIVITFDQPVVAGDGFIWLYTPSDGTSTGFNVPGEYVTGLGTDTITVRPYFKLDTQEEHSINIDATAFDNGDGESFAGIASNDETTWNFTTGSLAAEDDRVVFDPIAPELDEGTTFDVDVYLTEPILAAENDPTVEITLVPSNTDRLTVSPSVITFTADEWNQNKTFTITAVDEADVYLFLDNPEYLSFSVASESELYSGFEGLIPVTVNDNDTPQVATVGVTNISRESAFFQGQALDDIAEFNEENAFGFLLGTTPGVTLANYDVALGPVVNPLEEDGSFTLDYDEFRDRFAGTEEAIPPLECGANYYYKALGSFGGTGDISFGEEFSFTTVSCATTQTRRTSSSISYTCKDNIASNYNRFGRHKQALCEYEVTEEETPTDTEVILEPTTELSESNTCSLEQTLTQNLKAPSRNGTYNSYTNDTVTEAHILQAHLNQLGFNSGPEDGILGPLTDGAIKRMQTFLGTKADGYVGPLTRAFINESCEKVGLES